VSFGILLLFFSNNVNSQTDTNSLSTRVKVLENNWSAVHEEYNLNIAKLDSSIDDKISNRVSEINDAKRQLDLLTYFGLPITIASIIGLYFLALKKAKKFVVDKIENIVEHKREEIINLIETQEYDSRLRKNKKLLVLSPDEDSQEKIKLFIDKLKFNNVKYRPIDKYQKFEDYDLIIFNDHYTSFNQDLITEFITNIEEEHINFVAYTKNKLAPNHRLNFSNSPFTLYHSILSTLKYGEILKIQDI